MRAIFQIVILLVVILASFGCKTTQAQWRKQFLVSHGFHQDNPNGLTYSRNYDSLDEASQDLGFSITNLKVPINRWILDPDNERIAMVNGWGFVITAHGTNSLDELTPCAVATAIVQYEPKVYLATKSYPRLRLISVDEPQQRSQPLQVTLEVAAVGKTPLTLSQDQFSVHIDSHQPESFLFIGRSFFEKKEPKIFKISPQKPITLTLTTFTNDLGGGEYWNKLPHGSYLLRVYITGGKEQQFDYQWRGQDYSDDYKLVIK